MGMRRVYTCDICRDEIKEVNDALGVNFINNKEFTLGGYGCTDGVHICGTCAKQLKEQLSNIDLDTF